MAFSADVAGNRSCPSKKGSKSGSCISKGSASSLDSTEAPKSAVYAMVGAVASATNPQAAVAARLPSLNNDDESEEKAASSSRQQITQAFDNSGYATYSEIQAPRRGSSVAVPTQREPARGKPTATPTLSDYDDPTNALSDGQKDRKPTGDEDNKYADPWDLTDFGRSLRCLQQQPPPTSSSPPPPVPRSLKRTTPPDTDTPIDVRDRKSAKTSPPSQKTASTNDAGLRSRNRQFRKYAIFQTTPANFASPQNKDSRCATRTSMQQPLQFSGTSSLEPQTQDNSSRKKLARPSQPPPTPLRPPSPRTQTSQQHPLLTPLPRSLLASSQSPLPRPRRPDWYTLPLTEGL